MRRLYPLGLWFPARGNALAFNNASLPDASLTTPPPLICFHGTVASGGSWMPLVEELRDRPVACPTYGNRGTAPITQCVDEAWEVVQDVLTRTGAHQVDLVGHSLGARVADEIVARFSERRDGDSIFPIRKVVALGGTHLGLPKPWWSPLAPVFAGSAVRQQFGTRSRKTGAVPGTESVQWSDVHGSADVIVPAAPGATVVDRVPHHLLPSSPRVAKVIAEILRDDTQKRQASGE